jgi:glutaredoxin 2
MYSKSLDIIRKLELQKKNKNISTAGIIDQRNLDKYTQKLSLFIVQKKLTDADLLESTTLFQQAKTKENYIKFHQSLQRTAKAIEPIKDDLNTFTLMFELWPQLVAVFPKEQQFMGTSEMYLTLLPKIKSLNQGVESYYNEISTTLAKTTANLSVAF